MSVYDQISLLVGYCDVQPGVQLIMAYAKQIFGLAKVHSSPTCRNQMLIDLGCNFAVSSSLGANHQHDPWTGIMMTCKLHR
eukprot:scaffold66793_cov20-Prasinocladus_malaysianus.AAC.1